MLYGLMSGIIPIDGVNEAWPLSNDAGWKLTVTPIGTARATEMQGVIDNSDLLNGAVGIVQEGAKFVISGKAAGDWDSAGDYRDALLLIVSNYIPYSAYTFEADVSQAATTGTGNGSNTTTGGGSGAANSTGGIPSKIFGIDIKLIVGIGAAVLIFSSMKSK